MDHQLLHEGYLGRLTHKALALYLFLAVVGDSSGGSFYSTSSIGNILRMNLFEVTRAKDELLKEHLIDYKKPYWRVLTLSYPGRSEITGGVTRITPLLKQVLKNSEVMKND
ncbi:MAG: hypothetical protein KKB12_00535 [Candidatus Omnitrophica bacterium]|nr:hypothetical protein [Candidatus Omnitrophota bacterium]